MPDTHAALTWDGTGTRFYETGTKKGVLYPMGANGAYEKGVAWNGLTAVTMSPEGAEATDLWADNIKYGTLRSAEQLKFTIEAYTYPEEFMECDGTKQPTNCPGVYFGQQARKAFGFCYRTEIGSDAAVADASGSPYKLHIVYGATAAPSERSYATINDNPEAITFSWECETNPAATTAAGMKPVSEIVIDSRYADATKLAALEAKLYGSTTADAMLPTPDQIITDMASV